MNRLLVFLLWPQIIPNIHTKYSQGVRAESALFDSSMLYDSVFLEMTYDNKK